MFGVAERIFFQSKIFSVAEKRSGLRSIDQMSGITTVLPKCRVLLLQYLLPPHLHSYGFSGLLPVEDSTGGELRLQGVLLDGGLHRPTFTVYDHVGVCTCMTTCISVKGDDAGETLVFRGGGQRPLTSCAILVLKSFGSVDVDVGHGLRVTQE